MASVGVNPSCLYTLGLAKLAEKSEDSMSEMLIIATSGSCCAEVMVVLPIVAAMAAGWSLDGKVLRPLLWLVIRQRHGQNVPAPCAEAVRRVLELPTTSRTAPLALSIATAPQRLSSARGCTIPSMMSCVRRDTESCSCGEVGSFSTHATSSSRSQRQGLQPHFTTLGEDVSSRARFGTGRPIHVQVREFCE